MPEETQNRYQEKNNQSDKSKEQLKNFFEVKSIIWRGKDIFNKIRSSLSIGDVPKANLFFKTQLKINLFLILDASFIYPFKKILKNILCFFN